MPPLILPVFAGMIPWNPLVTTAFRYSPRIRGDDPSMHLKASDEDVFSPYSRG